MNGRTILLELLLSGFFAVACLRACLPAAPESKPGFSGLATALLGLPGRIERLRRSRWQWFAMVSLMIVLRLQQQLPLVLELMAAFQFLVFIALPTRNAARKEEGKGNPSAA